jgi:Uma2 family endonuclease
MAAKIEPILTIADLEAMPDDSNRYELIEGELFVSRAPGLKHQRIVRNLLHAIQNYLDLNPVGEILPGPGVIFSDFSGVIPDLIYMSNKRSAEIDTGERLEGAPELIIEVLSPGAENERRDRQVKRQLYHKYGIKEYWIVDPSRSTVDIYRAPGFKLAASMNSRVEITSPLLPGFHCSVRDLFVQPLLPRKQIRKKKNK